MKMHYCEYITTLSENTKNPNKHYHDFEYGFPIATDNDLFGRLVLEINQAGLSWTTILNKKERFRVAYDNFEIQKIANYTDKDRNRLLNDSGIIRNRLKIEAAIYNAKSVQIIQQQYGSFTNWLNTQGVDNLDDWIYLLKEKFKFVGREIVNEFLMSTGYLPGAHMPSCPVFEQVKACRPQWLQKKIILK